MRPKEFKELKIKLKGVFQRILNNFYTDFTEVNVSEAKGQVFIINAFYGEEYLDGDKPIDRVNIVRPILHFQASDFWKNEMLDINSFFNINEEVFDEFYEMGQRGELNELLPILKDSLIYFTPKEIGYSSANNYFFLSIDSCIQGGDQFYRDLLNEGIAVIGYDEKSDSIDVDITLSERKKITALIDNKPVNLKLPFEKIDNFDTFQKEANHPKIDKNYIFILMSFQYSPFLEDTISTIKRSVNDIKTGLTCERVDDIQDDFVISDKIFDCIKKAYVLIVDLTDNRPNVYYELGYARALGKKIILICKEGEQPHFDVSNQNTIFYNNATSLEKALKARLRIIYRN